MNSWHVNMTWGVVISGHVTKEPFSPKDGHLRLQRAETPLPNDGNLLYRRTGTSFPMLLLQARSPFSKGWDTPFQKDGNLLFRWVGNAASERMGTAF